MFKNVIPILGIAALTLCGLTTKAEDAPATSTNAPVAGTNTGDAKPPLRKRQSEVASKTATFGSVAKTDESYKSALDAHDLDKAFKEVSKPGTFKGTVSGVYEPRGGAMAILNFDANYKTALNATLRRHDFTNFPDLKKLVGKEVVVSGTFLDFQGRAEIVLTNVAQVKLAEDAK